MPGYNLNIIWNINQAIHQIGFFDSANSYKKSSYSFDITECYRQQYNINEAIHQIGFFDSANSYKKSSYSFDITDCVTNNNVISINQFTRSAFLIAQILIKSQVTALISLSVLQRAM